MKYSSLAAFAAATLILSTNAAAQSIIGTTDAGNQCVVFPTPAVGLPNPTQNNVPALPPGCPVGKTLLYPFAGPDFFNAWWMFPECETFVLFGLEHIGEVPNVEGMNPRQQERRPRASARAGSAVASVSLPSADAKGVLRECGA